jgi:colanic acid/amylovoran biosynthesis glycosyltransferase
MKPKKLLLVVPAFPKLSESFIVRKFLGLLNAGWDVHIFCAASSAAEWQHFPELATRSGIRRRVHVGWPQRPRALAAALIPAALLRLALTAPAATIRYLSRGRKLFGTDVLRHLYQDAEIIRLQPDIVHFEFGALAVGRVYIADLLSCRIVASFRGYDLNLVGLDDPEYYTELWSRADGLHFLGQALWETAQRRGCPASRQHALIPPAIDMDVFGPSAATASEPRAAAPLQLLSVGRLDWRKGYEYGLMAVKLLIEQGVNCCYKIAGGGSYLEAVAFARHQLGLEDVVELLGPLDPVAVRAEMRQTDIFLHPAVSEGFSNAVLEAQAMQLPVVCTDAGGLPENVVAGETGLVARRRDAGHLAEHLYRLSANPDLRRQMGQAGQRRVEKFFSMKTQIRAFEDLYNQVTGGPLSVYEGDAAAS